LALLSVVALVSHLTNDGIFLWLVFNIAFALPWKSIEEGGFVGTILSKINITEYLSLLDKVPKYEEPKVSESAKSK